MTRETDAIFDKLSKIDETTSSMRTDLAVHLATHESMDDFVAKHERTLYGHRGITTKVAIHAWCFRVIGAILLGGGGILLVTKFFGG